MGFLDRLFRNKEEPTAQNVSETQESPDDQDENSCPNCHTTLSESARCKGSVILECPNCGKSFLDAFDFTEIE